MLFHRIRFFFCPSNTFFNQIFVCNDIVTHFLPMTLNLLTIFMDRTNISFKPIIWNPFINFLQFQMQQIYMSNNSMFSLLHDFFNPKSLFFDCIATIYFLSLSFQLFLFYIQPQLLEFLKFFNISSSLKVFFF